jgi:biopolymer transport protein ExbD
MKNSHAPSAALLLAASLLAAAHTAARPASFDGAAQDATKREGARESATTVIVIAVDAERRVYFGKERVGTCDDVGPLKQRVREAVEGNRRAARDKADEEAARSAGTVFICATPDLKYGDVVKVVDAIKEAGGDPVGLDTDCAPPG